ncbi:MAG: hypothetical protein Q7T05_01340 [Dehalococcoidia bacterium]|nr:hypothetical protein [Dehalococcoidia bacterium]
MATTGKQKRMTLDVGDERLYSAIRHAAAERDKPVAEIVAEALRKWLEDQEEQEDLAAMRAVKDEPTIPWEQVKAEIRAAEAAEGITSRL